MRLRCGSLVLVRTMSSGRGNPPLHCSELVRTTDHEHYVATLVLPEKLRTASFALRALGSEVAGIRDSVSDRTLGMVRTQFWKDAVTNMFQEGKAVPNHPVVTELKRISLDLVTPFCPTNPLEPWSRLKSMEKQPFPASTSYFWKFWAMTMDMQNMRQHSSANARV